MTAEEFRAWTGHPAERLRRPAAVRAILPLIVLGALLWRPGVAGPLPYWCSCPRPYPTVPCRSP